MRNKERMDILTGEGDVEGLDPALCEGRSACVSSLTGCQSVCEGVCVSESSTV